MRMPVKAANCWPTMSVDIGLRVNKPKVFQTKRIASGRPIIGLNLEPVSPTLFIERYMVRRTKAVRLKPQQSATR